MSFWRKFVWSLTPNRHYVDLADQPAKESFHYFVKLATLMGLLYGFLWVFPSNLIAQNVQAFCQHLATEMPVVEIRNGKAKVLGEQPRTIDLAFNALLRIDTTGNVLDPPRELNGRVAPTSFLIREDGLRYQVGGKTGTLSFEGIEYLLIDSNFWRQQAQRWSPRLTLIILVYYPLKFLVADFIKYVIMSGVAMFMETVFKANIEFFRLLSVCIYALTPMRIIGAGLTYLTAISVSRWTGDITFLALLANLVFYCIYAAYVGIGVWRLSKTYPAVEEAG